MIRWFKKLSFEGWLLLGLGAAAAPFVLGFLALMIWMAIGGTEYRESRRVRSPDGGLEVVLTLSQLQNQPLAGTVPFYREIDIERAGAPPISDKIDREGFVLSDDTVDIDEFRWLGPDNLLIVLEAGPGYAKPAKQTIKVSDGVRQRNVVVDFKINPRSD